MKSRNGCAILSQEGIQALSPFRVMHTILPRLHTNESGSMIGDAGLFLTLLVVVWPRRDPVHADIHNAFRF